MDTKSRNNIPAHLRTLPKAKSYDLRAKIGKDLRKKLDEKNPTPASPADDVSNWAGAVHVEAVHPSSSVSEDPVLQEVPAVFANVDVRD